MKRFVRRWLDRIERMPARRRGYVMHKLAEAIVQRHGRRSALADPATTPLALAAVNAIAGAAVRNASGGATVRNASGGAGGRQ